MTNFKHFHAMKRFLTILSALLLTLTCGQALAQGTAKTGAGKAGNDYNLQRAWEALDQERDDAKALDLVDIKLMDHVVVAGGQYASLNDLGGMRLYMY